MLNFWICFDPDPYFFFLIYNNLFKHFSAALRKVIASARSEDVPKTTIENAIKKATNVAEQQELLFEMLGPGSRFKKILNFT